MVLEQYDSIRIVSLPERKDRRREMQYELRKVGMENDSRVSFFDAFRRATPGPFRSCGSHGNYDSHVTILEEAAAAGESVLILEDDCEFLPGITACRLPANTDIFYGGFYASDPSDLHRSDIIGSHFMGFSAEAASKASRYLTRLRDPAFPPDAEAAARPDFNPAIRPSIDGALVWFRRAHPELRTVFHLVANQRSSRSDVTPQHFFDQVAGLRGLASLARRLKRRLRAA